MRWSLSPRSLQFFFQTQRCHLFTNSTAQSIHAHCKPRTTFLLGLIKPGLTLSTIIPRRMLGTKTTCASPKGDHPHRKAWWASIALCGLFYFSWKGGPFLKLKMYTLNKQHPIWQKTFRIPFERWRWKGKGHHVHPNQQQQQEKIKVLEWPSQSTDLNPIVRLRGDEEGWVQEIRHSCK